MLLYCNSEMLQFAILNMHVVVALLSVLAFACLSLAFVVAAAARCCSCFPSPYLPLSYLFPCLKISLAFEEN